MLFNPNRYSEWLLLSKITMSKISSCDVERMLICYIRFTLLTCINKSKTPKVKPQKLACEIGLKTERFVGNSYLCQRNVDG